MKQIVIRESGDAFKMKGTGLNPNECAGILLLTLLNVVVRNTNIFDATIVEAARSAAPNKQITKRRKRAS